MECCRTLQNLKHLEITNFYVYIYDRAASIILVINQLNAQILVL